MVSGGAYLPLKFFRGLKFSFEKYFIFEMSVAIGGKYFCYVGGWEGRLGKKICIFQRLLLCGGIGRAFGKENLCFS